MTLWHGAPNVLIRPWVGAGDYSHDRFERCFFWLEPVVVGVLTLQTTDRQTTVGGVREGWRRVLPVEWLIRT